MVKKANSGIRFSKKQDVNRGINLQKGGLPIFFLEKD
jgi:hypothetical protein